MYSIYIASQSLSRSEFLSLCHRRRVAGLSVLYKANSNSSHCLFSELPSASILEFNIHELRPQLIHWSLKYQGVERPNLRGLSCRLRCECGMTFPTLCSPPEHWMGSRVQPTVCCFPELRFLQFSLTQVLVGSRKQFINNFVFPTWAGAAGFNNNNNNNSTYHRHRKNTSESNIMDFAVV